jgi:hypothetical protein
MPKRVPAFEWIGDLVVGKASPILRSAMGIQDHQSQGATSGIKNNIGLGGHRIAV